MMPCNVCGLHDPKGTVNRGLKQVGKTKQDGTKFERIYRCQDCGMLWRMTGDTAAKIARDRPIFTVVKGGKA